jgi:hypothetical protein
MMATGVAWQRPGKQFKVGLVNRSVMCHGCATTMVIYVGGAL